MCYLVAKDFNKHGCVALKTEIGESLRDLLMSIQGELKNDDIEIVTISRPTAYGEYAPYTFVDTEQEFREAVAEME